MHYKYSSPLIKTALRPKYNEVLDVNVTHAFFLSRFCRFPFRLLYADALAFKSLSIWVNCCKHTYIKEKLKLPMDFKIMENTQEKHE